MELANKKVIITGISKGIGKELALALLAKGCHVAGLGQTKPNYAHPNLHFVKTDMRRYEQVEEAFKEVISLWNGELHILINNAGLGYFGKLEDLPLEQYHEMMEVNVNGVF